MIRQDILRFFLFFLHFYCPRNREGHTFGEDSYTVVTAATTSTFRYELIDALAESQDYIIFLMKKRYAQPLDKRTLTGGTVEEFKRFLEEKTGKTFRRVK